MTKSLFLLLGLVVSQALAADVTIPLSSNEQISRKTVSYKCDANGAHLGLPSTSFNVEYINGAGNSLAVVPLSNKTLIFANVLSGSGARYVAQQYTWWDAKGAVTLSSLTTNLQSTCRPATK